VTALRGGWCPKLQRPPLLNEATTFLSKGKPGVSVEKMEVLGWAGTVLVIVAYAPQIHHLFVEKCAWGISLWTWLIWLLASTLLLTYCALRREFLMSAAQGVNIVAIVTTIILVRRSNNVCPYHRKIAGAKAQR
jgi:uncharacterized protein with PQ loop repeat